MSGLLIDDSKLLKIIRPVVETVSEIKSVVIRDSAIDSMCHGAQLAIPGVLQISQYLTIKLTKINGFI